ncbi:MAG: cell division protein [Gammaproteobacteria bacterium TMED78]|nr:MAG: cell division protein [Gammaproteobacteria bacterium TMED78]|tara:strand:- start:82124 stop:83842 length:1719 start_codon:yes stop_codon:yes gene_type:complete
MTKKNKIELFWTRWRSFFILGSFFIGAILLEGRFIYLQVIEKDFLVDQGDLRQIRTVPILSNRGRILDRAGEPLAVSTPVDSIGANPKKLPTELEKIRTLAEILGLESSFLIRKITSNKDKDFIYLRRHLNPELTLQVLNLSLPGIEVRREYRRYYPSGEVTSHLLGFTDIDDKGLEGVELAYNGWLQGEPGKKRVLRDREERIIQDIELINKEKPGKELVLSIDLRLQYFAYRELKQAVEDNSAISGSIVILDIKSGEILAMVNQPFYNPNNRSKFDIGAYRNRAITDVFEPGSSIKPFILAAALESGIYDIDSIIDTSPGYLKVNDRVITEDYTNLGEVDISTILAKSSNVGSAIIGLGLEENQLWSSLSNFGFGRLTGVGLQGESAGIFNIPQNWNPTSQATLSYGYGLSVTPLQLAQAYSVIANRGMMKSVSILSSDIASSPKRIISEKTANHVIKMMEGVVSPGGTGTLASVKNYRVAGKTGTAKKSESGSYTDDKYTSVFAGFAPASEPQFAIVVVIDEPNATSYYGGEVAAPIFSKVMDGALRISSIRPDGIEMTTQNKIAKVSK